MSRSYSSEQSHKLIDNRARNSIRESFSGISGRVRASFTSAAQVVDRATNGETALIRMLRDPSAELEDIRSEVASRDADYINQKSNRGDRALVIAAEQGWSEAVDLLLAHGAQVNKRGIGDKTALYASAERGHLGVAQRLLGEEGVNKTRKAGSESGFATPLIIAAIKNKFNVVKCFVAEGIDINEKDLNGYNAMMRILLDEKIPSSTCINMARKLEGLGANLEGELSYDLYGAGAIGVTFVEAMTLDRNERVLALIEKLGPERETSLDDTRSSARLKSSRNFVDDQVAEEFEESDICSGMQI